MSQSAPPGFPSNIPISQETFENWSQGIKVPDLWTAVPQSYDDVVAVCNWAASAGYEVRPRGIMHNWSPLTVTEDESPANVVLLDTTQKLNQVLSVTAASGNQPAQVKVQTGTTMLDLMIALENADGGNGSANGFSFAHIPAPGNITVGGALAINAHGTAVPTPPNDSFNIPYGTLSNLILAFTAVVTDPASPTSPYAAKTFQRGQGDDKAFLTHCGRAFLLDVTLQAVDNYNLRCQSMMNITADTLFAAPATPTGPPPAQSVGDFLNQSGRVEVIWFPPLPSAAGDPVPTTYPWLKVWTVTPKKPLLAIKVKGPYNYGFSDNLPTWLSDMLKEITAALPGLTPTFTSGMAGFTKFMLTVGLLTDLWGPSKDLLLYVKDSTLRVTANGYVVLMKKNEVQQAIADFTKAFVDLLVKYQNDGYYPINSPCEIRVTALDDPSLIVTPSGHAAQSPVISSLSVDPVVQQNGWEVGVWFDVLTALPFTDPNSQQAYNFYSDMEQWVIDRFGAGYRQMPEWSKGWAYTADQGPWTNINYIDNIKLTFTTGRADDDNWAWEDATLHNYDAANLFTNPFLKSLFPESQTPST
ncbi:MAG TPA: cholesterol oxidase substrate-binding domain-containing protein [Blastocatellia bacterium]|nr:cholesterol oxidase substrate-binding domain-containing protein [Blastocatellia bacterium]